MKTSLVMAVIQITLAVVKLKPEKIPWGRGTPLYGLYRYVQPQRVWFFSRFGHK